MKRLLVTGSRNWTDRHAIGLALDGARDELSAYGAPVVLVHGGCRGADSIAGDIWASWGQPVEVWHADWDGECRPTCTPHHRKPTPTGEVICPAAGLYRNGDMVAAGADLCLVFILGASRGANHRADLAELAGIPVRRITPSWPGYRSAGSHPNWRHDMPDDTGVPDATIERVAQAMYERYHWQKAEAALAAGKPPTLNAPWGDGNTRTFWHGVAIAGLLAAPPPADDAVDVVAREMLARTWEHARDGGHDYPEFWEDTPEVHERDFHAATQRATELANRQRPDKDAYQRAYRLLADRADGEAS